MSAGSSPAPSCPVCGLPAGTGQVCEECGWTLRTGWRQGPVTEALRADFDTRLGAARRKFDARAAALISPDPDRFAPWIRAGRPDAAEWASARREATAAASGAIDAETARETLTGILRGRGRVAVVEIGPDGIGAARIASDELGLPRLDRDRPVAPWANLLPMLAADGDQRMFQLAGGVVGLDRPALHGCLADAVPAGLEDDVLVICQPAGWMLLDQVARLTCQGFSKARLIRIAGMPVTENRPLDSLIAGMPLLHGYGVVVATIDPDTGEVRAGTRPLFGAGDVAGAEASVSLRRVPGDRGDVTVAVVADGNGSGPQVLAAYSVRQPDQAVYEVWATLEAPGRVRLSESLGAAQATRTWTELMASVPCRVDVRPGPVDLVCAIELAGTKKQVDQRRDLVRALLEQLVDEYPGPDSLRVGLLGCTDHAFEPGEEKRRVVRREPLASAPDALLSLSRFRGHAVRYPPAAPLEDMLYEAHRMLAESHAEGRAPRLLLVAGRRPHPRAFGADKVHPCPFRCDWHSLTRALAGSAVSTVAVLDAMPGRTSRTAFWADVGKAGLHVLTQTTSRTVGEDLGVLVRCDQRIGIPLST